MDGMPMGLPIIVRWAWGISLRRSGNWERCCTWRSARCVEVCCRSPGSGGSSAQRAQVAEYQQQREQPYDEKAADQRKDPVDHQMTDDRPGRRPNEKETCPING